MKMNIRDAISILEITEKSLTEEKLKLAYRRAAQKYHPDRNPAGLEMMKLVNAAYESLKNCCGNIEAGEHGASEYGEHINAALNAIIGLGLNIEVCGAWVWISGNTKPHKEKLKEAGFKWASKKCCWYFRPEDYKSRRHKSWLMSDIRNKYGSQIIKNEQTSLAANV